MIEALVMVPHKLYKAIVEQHNERYLQQSVAYLTQCKAFADAGEASPEGLTFFRLQVFLSIFFSGSGI